MNRFSDVGFSKIGLLTLLVLIIAGLSFMLAGKTVKAPAPASVPEEAISKGSGALKPDIPAKRFKILHIMSYHTPWIWTKEQFNGFKDALRGFNIEYKVFQMDTKRKSSAEWKESAGKEAREMIDEWRPDLVYTNDDNAQIYVAKYYINSDIPFVYSGVNADPAGYGFTGSENMAGVLAQEHFTASVGLLQQIAPGIKRIAVITDDGPTWPPVIERMKEKAPGQLPEIEFVSWDIVQTFREYKQKVKEYHSKADAIIHLGVFTFRDEAGNNVPFEEVMRWTVDNSRLPDTSFWKDRVESGELCAMAVSGYEQGRSAGEIARSILAEGRSPSDCGFKPTYKGEPVVSLARAKALGINVHSSLLLNVEVINKFSWEE